MFHHKQSGETLKGFAHLPSLLFLDLGKYLLSYFYGHPNS